MSKGRVACCATEYTRVSLDFSISGVGRVSHVVIGTADAKFKVLVLPHCFPVQAIVRAIWTPSLRRRRGGGGVVTVEAYARLFLKLTMVQKTLRCTVCSVVFSKISLFWVQFLCCGKSDQNIMILLLYDFYAEKTLMTINSLQDSF